MQDIFLIEQAFFDPTETRRAHWYEPVGYKLNEQEAKDFCESQGHYTEEDFRSIRYTKEKKLSKYRFTKVLFLA